MSHHYAPVDLGARRSLSTRRNLDARRNVELEHPTRAELDHDADNDNDDALYDVMHQVKAQAWDEGWHSRDTNRHGVNPYRKVDTAGEAGPGRHDG